ncbi:MAG: IS110 family transposase [Propionibacteriaceae bacterium]|jgi:transposase|nr:IS110 family transposase [Propionibacteriaceae bacterium]
MYKTGQPLLSPGQVVVGVDTHKYFHVAVVLNNIGGRLSSIVVSTDKAGFQQLLDWATSFGTVFKFGIEGTSSYGKTLTSFLRNRGYQVIEAARPERRLRRGNGKTDAADAEAAARGILSGTASAIPKSHDGYVEMLRELKVAYSSAVKMRTQTFLRIDGLLVGAPEELRNKTLGLSNKQVAQVCAGLRPPVKLQTPQDALKCALKTLGQLWLTLNKETNNLSKHISGLTQQIAPQLLDLVGIGPDTAAEILIVFGDNLERIKSEAAFAKLAGVAPIPTGSGLTAGKHRINHGGYRQLNAALYRAAITRLHYYQPSINYAAKRSTEGKTRKDIIRCIKRYIARDIWKTLHPHQPTTQPQPQTPTTPKTPQKTT